MSISYRYYTESVLSARADFVQINLYVTIVMSSMQQIFFTIHRGDTSY